MNITKSKIWNSPTSMTLLSYFTKSASILLITPLILSKFQEIEIVIWYLFATIISMNGLADLGFRNTFVRFISYANGGAKEILNSKSQNISKTNGETNWNLVGKIFSHMKFIYIIVSILLAIVLMIGGYFSLLSTFNKVDNSFVYWLSWIIISTASVLDFYGKIYYNYLEGLNEIALVKRVESVFKISTILLSFLVMLFYPSILNLSIVISLHYIFNFLRNFFLAKKIKNGEFKKLKKFNIEKQFLKDIWKPSWKSGASSLIGIGVINFLSILVVQFSSTSAGASYLLIMRIITEIRNVANAPFYSKIPLLAKLSAEGKIQEMIIQAKKGMKYSHLMYVLGVILAGVIINPLLEYLGSNLGSIDINMWILLSFAFYIHRYGALHIQLYMTSNHIISHIADSVSAVIFILGTYLLIDYIELYAIPVAMIIGYLGFYAWYAAYNSYKLLNQNLFSFESQTSIPSVFILIIYYIFVIYI
jgi:O-antigen/teichoic acid export membrane protein